MQTRWVFFKPGFTGFMGHWDANGILVQNIPAAEKPHSASTDAGGGLTANRSTRAVACDHAHRCTRKLLSCFYSITHRLVICAITQHFNCFLILHAFLCSTDIQNLKPSNPVFLPAHKPGFDEFENVWNPATRIFGYQGCIPYSRQNGHFTFMKLLYHESTFVVII